MKHSVFSKKADSRGFDPDQDALVQLAKEAEAKGGVTPDQASTLEEWADEYRVPFRGPETHPNRKFNQPHIHVGPVNHILLQERAR
jgi:hypothetical protein